MKKYNMSKKRKKRDLMQTDLDKRICIFIKVNQGWSFRELGSFYDQSHQSIAEIYNKIKDMTIKELEAQRAEMENVKV